MTTTAPVTDRFTENPDGTYTCPKCQRRYVYPKAAARHWERQHATADDDAPDDGLDDLRAMWDEIQAEKTDQTPPAEPVTDGDDAGVEGPGEEVEPNPPAAPSRPGSNDVTFLPPAAVWARVTSTRTDSTLHGVTVLVDAVVRLRNVGFPSGEARRLVFDLIDRLNEPHTAA